MNKLDYENLMIVDLEATCCNRKTVPRDKMEIIEIGAVMVERKSLTVLSEFQTFIKPVRTPELTEFCKELTTITQQDVDSAPLFKEAMESFTKWYNDYSDVVFCSWGDYDRNQFIQDCKYHRLEFPVKGDHVNIKKLFSKNLGLRRNYGMAGALRHCGLKLSGTHHRGIDDAQNMAAMLPYFLK